MLTDEECGQSFKAWFSGAVSTESKRHCLSNCKDRAIQLFINICGNVMYSINKQMRGQTELVIYMRSHKK